MELMRKSYWWKDQGMLTSRVVLRYMKGAFQPWVTHVECIMKDKSTYYTWGHYFRNKKRANNSFVERCERYKVEEDIPEQSMPEWDESEKQWV